MIQRKRKGSSSSTRAALFYAMYFGALGVIMPFLGPYLGSRGISAVGIGLITAAFSLSKVGYAPLFGWLVDRGLRFRGMLSLHVTVSLAAALALDLVNGPLALGAIILVIGPGYGTVLPLVEASVLEQSRRIGYGAVRVWGSLGFVITAVAGGRLLTGDGIKSFTPALSLLLLALALSCLPLEGRERTRPKGEPKKLSGLVWWFLILLTFHQVVHGPYYAFFSIHLQEHGMTGQTIGLMWSVGVAAEMLAFILGSRIELGLGRRGVLTMALVATPLRWILMALPVSMPLVVMAQIGHAFSFGLAHLASIQLLQQAAGPGSARRAQALYASIPFGVGAVAGAAAAGPIYSACGGVGAFLSAAALSAAILAAWLFMSPRFRTTELS